MATILALDLGKFKSASCFFNTDTCDLRHLTRTVRAISSVIGKIDPASFLDHLGDKGEMGNR